MYLYLISNGGGIEDFSSSVIELGDILLIREAKT
jgi:hypothetical protein